MHVAYVYIVCVVCNLGDRMQWYSIFSQIVCFNKLNKFEGSDSKNYNKSGKGVT